MGLLHFGRKSHSHGEALCAAVPWVGSCGHLVPARPCRCRKGIYILILLRALLQPRSNCHGRSGCGAPIPGSISEQLKADPAAQRSFCATSRSAVHSQAGRWCHPTCGGSGEMEERGRECALGAEGVMERGGNGHERVWQIKASPFVLLLCR